MFGTRPLVPAAVAEAGWRSLEAPCATKPIAAPETAASARASPALPGPSLCGVTRAATLFDADAASYTGTVEVLGVIFSAEDDGYAVLEVQETESRRGLRAGRPGRPPRRRRPGRGQRRVADPLPLRPPAAGPGRAAARPGRPRGPGRLPDLAAPHRPDARRAAGRRARRGGAGGDRRRPGSGSSARCAGSAPTRPRRRPSPGTRAAAIRDLHVAARARTGSPTWRRRSTPATASSRWRSCTRTPTG